jgi:hypothetical protein
MPPKFSCGQCSKRLRRDGSCPTEGCAKFRPSRRASCKLSQSKCGMCSKSVRLDGSCSSGECRNFKPSHRVLTKWRKETVAHWRAITPKSSMTPRPARSSRISSQASPAGPSQECAVNVTGLASIPVHPAHAEPTATSAHNQPQQALVQAPPTQALSGLPLTSVAAATCASLLRPSSAHNQVRAFISQPKLLASSVQQMGPAVAHGVFATAHSILNRCSMVPAGAAPQVGAALLGVAGALTCPSYMRTDPEGMEEISSAAWRTWFQRCAGEEHQREARRIEPEWVMLLPFAHGLS